ncbi:class I SAM-dependent methyltransferase [Bradyrhizobium centrolobii]|uniref:class I SAM-dependent methyltransferase n=1 Tax=Bradyrhizobium centrolobii TaxID=1505087 RepID=UPI001FDA9E32|nr:methyltransferase domain-containing protein [Bradyrhizobium centrolobii]
MRLLLGGTLHPGGTALTERLGVMLNLGPRARVLDVAAGRGTSAFTLAMRFGCEVIGLDYSRRSVEAAKRDAAARGLSSTVSFCCGDTERLPFADGSFDAVVCECALCTFPDKRTATAEFARVLRAGGRVGLSDLTRQGLLPPELESLAAWIACIADAQPLAEYASLLAAAGFKIKTTEEHNGALIDFVNHIRTRLLVTEVMLGLNKLALPGFDIAMVKDFTQHALAVIKAGKLGYAIVTAAKEG